MSIENGWGLYGKQALKRAMRRHFVRVVKLLREELPVKAATDMIRADWRTAVEPLLADPRCDEDEDDQVFDFSERPGKEHVDD
jgi:hypothetical protein